MKTKLHELLRQDGKDQQAMGLKPGDTAYYVHTYYSANYGHFHKITITGNCDEGHGYTGVSDFGDEIHTCNEYLCRTLREAQNICLEINKKALADYKERQSNISRHIEYLQWAIQNPKRIQSDTTPMFDEESRTRIKQFNEENTANI